MLSVNLISLTWQLTVDIQMIFSTNIRNIKSSDIMPSVSTLPQQTFCSSAEITEGILCSRLNSPVLFETPVITNYLHCELGVPNGGAGQV
jgi:hypothetical protein